MFTYRPDRIFWSVMPMGADWCYTVVYMLGGEFAARLLNFAMLLLVEALLYPSRAALSVPPSHFVLWPCLRAPHGATGHRLDVHREFPGRNGAWNRRGDLHFGETGERRFFIRSRAGGTALATKFGGMAFVGAALPVAAIELRRQWNRLGKWPWLTAPSQSCCCWHLPRPPI